MPELPAFALRRRSTRTCYECGGSAAAGIAISGGTALANGVLFELAQPISDGGFSVNYLLAPEPRPRRTYSALAPLLQEADALFDLARKLVFGEIVLENWHLPALFGDGVQECAPDSFNLSGALARAE